MNRSRVRLFLILPFLFSMLGPADASFESAQFDLWEGRFRYRHPFVEPNGPFKDDYDKLRKNWSGTTGLGSGTYPNRGILRTARNDFLVAADQSGRQDARQGAAESINEILSGQISDGQYLLIKALQTRYPFLSGDSEGDPGRPREDNWALRANGAIDQEVELFDHALIQLGIGLNSATGIVNRTDAVYDPAIRMGVLRAADPTDFYAGFPYFIRLTDPFHDPNTSFIVREPRSNTIQAELSQLCRLTGIRAQASYEKAAKYFQGSGKLSGENRLEERRKAQQTLKSANHLSYLTAVSLAALQSPKEFEQNKGPQIGVFAGQGAKLYRKLDDPNYLPRGNSDQFVPPTDRPVTSYITAANNAVDMAIRAEKEYRAHNQDDARRKSEIQEFVLEENNFLSELSSLSGFSVAEIKDDYHSLQSIEDRRAFVRAVIDRIDANLLHRGDPNSWPEVTCPGRRGFECLGKYGELILSVLDAQAQIRQGVERLQDIPRRIQIEEERSGQVIQIIYDGVSRLNAVEEALAIASSYSESSSKSQSNSYSFSSGVSVGVSGQQTGSVSISASLGYSYSKSTSDSISKNPKAGEVASLRREQNSARAHQEAQIEGTNSTATIRTILLDMDNIEVEIQRAQIRLIQERTRLGEFEDDLNKLIEDYIETVQVRRGQQDIYLNNPEFRRWYRESFKRMNARREEAIVALYELGRALAYYWVEDYRNPIFAGEGQQGIALTRYNSENFPDLESVFTIGTGNNCGDFYLALAEWDQKVRTVRGPSYELVNTRRYSLRDDIFFHDLYLSGAPLDRRIRDFRDFLSRSTFFGTQEAIIAQNPGFQITFPISLEILDDRQDWNQRIAYREEPDGFGGRVAPGILIEFEADAGFQERRKESVQIDVSQFGLISVAGFFNEPDLGIKNILRYEIPDPMSNFGRNRSDSSATKQAPINGRLSSQTSYLISTFNTRPLAATQWQLTLDTTRDQNKQVKIAKIRDIHFRVQRSRGEPVDPVTGLAYSFPALPSLTR